MIDAKRFIAAEIAVCQAIHKAIGERIELIGGTRLRDTGATTASLCIGGDRNARWAGEGGVGRGAPIDMKLPQAERGCGVQREERGRRASGRVCETIRGGK